MWSRYAGGRDIEGENIEKKYGRAKWWSPCIGGRLAEVVARRDLTVLMAILRLFGIFAIYPWLILKESVVQAK